MLNRINPVKISGSKKRIGRGYGSGKGGHTVGRGTKGQKARGKVHVGFEGGQIPLYKRLPQMGGFRNPTEKDVVPISLEKLNVFKDGSEVTPESLVAEGILRFVPKGGIKLLGGKLEKKLTLKGFKASKGAIKIIEKSESKMLE